MTNVNTHKDTTAIATIIREGFAVWMNQKYWKEKYSLAINLGYTENELQECNKKIEKIKGSCVSIILPQTKILLLR